MTPDVLFRSLKAAAVFVAVCGALAFRPMGWPWTHAFVAVGLWNTAQLWLLFQLLLSAVRRAPIWLTALRGVGLVGLLAILPLFLGAVHPTVSALLLGFHAPYAAMFLYVIAENYDRRAKGPGAKDEPKDMERGPRNDG